MAKIDNKKTSPEKKDSGDVTETHLTGPGELLTAGRKKLKLSKSDVARQLNLSTSVIEQLESNKYTDQLPDAFIRGYLRTYARAVDIDEGQVVAIYTQNIGLEIVRNYYVPSKDIAPVRSQIGSHMLWFKILSFVLIITLLVLGWMAFSQRNNDVSATANNSTSTLNVSRVNVGNQLANELADDTEVDRENNTTDDVVTRENVNYVKLEEQAIDATSADNLDFVQIESQPENITPEISNTDTTVEAELEFTFLDDCWVQVTDSNDEVLAVGLKSSGRRFSVSGIVPIKVVIGKPRAVSLQFNNELVDLTVYPAGQTARFTLGED
ncbi:MAG: cytoskeleton protein RodZ [Enterobacterales bacterium]|jgi:cytoskeleton protein RodZ